MQTLFIIAKIIGIALVATGFVHFLFGNKVSQGKVWRLKYLKSVRITIVGLSAVLFSIAVFYLVVHIIKIIQL